MMSSFELGSVCIFLMLPICYEFSCTFRYYFKFCVYYGCVMMFSIIILPIIIWKPRDVENLILASHLCRHISTLIGLKWELRGEDHLGKDQSFVIIANHQSSIDILGMFELWPIMKRCTVVAKKELLWAGPFGLASWLCGLIFIDRLNSEASRRAINDTTHNLRETKVKMWVFPEGTRKNTGKIHAFKKGAFHAAIASQLPILPVVFTRFYFLNSDKCDFNPGKVVITVLPPLKTTGLNFENMAELMDAAHASMVETYESTSKQLALEVEKDRSFMF